MDVGLPGKTYQCCAYVLAAFTSISTLEMYTQVFIEDIDPDNHSSVTPKILVPTQRDYRYVNCLKKEPPFDINKLGPG